MSASKSLIDAIKDAILTGNSGDISLHEMSFLSHLLDNSRGKKFFSEQEGADTTEKWTSFLMTRWILRFFRKIVMGVMWAIHVVWYLIVRKNRSRAVEVWKVSKKWLNDIINTKGWEKRWARIKKVDKQRALSMLDINASPVINFLVIAAAFIFAIYIIVLSFTIAMKDVMFPPLNMRVNEWGVTTIDQPCMESHSFFLLNASTFWRSTGINVNERDRVTFSVSGSMYSDIGEMDNAARDNRKLLYDRIRITPGIGNQSAEGTQYCIYNHQSGCYCKRSENARFGTLLCQVTDEHLKPSNSLDTIFQITEQTNSFTTKKAGMLFLTFNDVLLNEDNVFNMLMDRSVSASTMQKDLLDSKFFTYKRLDGSIDTTYKVRIKKAMTNDTMYKIVNEFFDKHSPDSTIWFQDNVGEYLVNIRVERNIWKSDLNCSKKLAMSVMREFEHCLRLDSGLHSHRGFWHSKVPIILGIILLYFLIDIIVSYRVQSRQRTEDEKSPSGN